MDMKTKTKDQNISITLTSLQVEPISRRERRSMDKERLGSNPLTCLMDPASVKMRNFEASSLKPNSPKQAHHEALASCVLDMLDLDRMSKTIPVSITECHCISLCVSVYTIFRISNKLYIRKGEKRKW